MSPARGAMYQSPVSEFTRCAFPEGNTLPVSTVCKEAKEQVSQSF